MHTPLTVSIDFRHLPTLELSMKKYYTLVMLCMCFFHYSYAQCPISTLAFEPVGTMAVASQVAGNDRQAAGGSKFCSTSTLMLSGSKYASEIDGFAAEETAASGIRRLPNKPSHPQASPVGDVPWGLMTCLIACYVMQIRLRTRYHKHTDAKKSRED